MINKHNILSLCQLNIDGLSRHSNIATQKYISDKNVKILALQEIGKFAPSIDSFTGMMTYGVNNNRGVSISVAKEYHPQLVTELEDNMIDAVFVTCTIKKLPILISSCYCRPEISSTKSLKSLLSHINKAWNWCKKTGIKNMLVMGDFNARSISWGDTINNPRGKALSEFIESSSDAKLHSAGRNTFLHSNGGSVIDLSISFGGITSLLSTPYTEQCYTLFTGAPQKGHIPVIQDLVVGTITLKRKRTVYNYDEADWKSWATDLNDVCKNELNSNIEAKELFYRFQAKLLECNKKFIPLKTICEHSKPFWSKNLSKLSLALQNAHQKYKERSDPINKAELEQCKTEFQIALTTEKNLWIHSQLEGLNTYESIEFWKRYKRQFVQKEANFIGHLFKDSKSQSILVDESSKEEALYHTFFTGEHMKEFEFDEEIYANINEEVSELRKKNWGINGENSHNSSKDKESNQELNSSPEFLSEDIELQEVKAAIKLQKTAGKCCDNDGFHPMLLKKLPPDAVKLLTLIFNKVLKTGHWIWESSLVTFIKKANKNSYLLPGSYRPLTISSYIGKIMERVLQRRLLLYCQQNEVIDNSQEGFLPNRNTSRYLYKMTSTILEARRRKLQAMVLLIDFQKAFDSVPVSSIIFKLKQYGVNGHFLKLMYSFLSSGTINIKVNDFIGPKRSVGKYGLPQGSVLSPLLFIIYISDLLSTKNLPTSVKEWTLVFKYADDGSVLITGRDTAECFKRMQIVCKYLTKWCSKWRLAVNCEKDKTEAIIVKTKNSSNSLIPKLTISGKEIEYVPSSKVLGITIDEDLNFHSHAKKTLSSCWNTWTRLSDRTTRKQGLNCSTLTILFKTAVLTKLFYAAPIWLSKNQSIFDKFIARVMLRITGSQFYPPNPVSQVVLNLPPLALQFELLVVKFHLKSLSQDDDIKSLIIQIEETPEHPFYKHVMWTKNYLSWKRNNSKVARNISLVDISPVDTQYTKAVMTQYQSNKWNVMIVNNSMEFFIKDADQDLVTSQHLNMVKTEQLTVTKLFMRDDKRVDNTDMLDFLHGRCLRFKDFKSSINRDKDPKSMLCLDCNKSIDSPQHKLFVCEAFKCSERDILISQMATEDLAIYKLIVIFTSDQDMKSAFRNLVKAICSSSTFGDEYQPSTPLKVTSESRRILQMDSLM